MTHASNATPPALGETQPARGIACPYRPTVRASARAVAASSLTRASRQSAASRPREEAARQSRNWARAHTAEGAEPRPVRHVVAWRGALKCNATRKHECNTSGPCNALSERTIGSHTTHSGHYSPVTYYMLRATTCTYAVLGSHRTHCTYQRNALHVPTQRTARTNACIVKQVHRHHHTPVPSEM